MLQALHLKHIWWPLFWVFNRKRYIYLFIFSNLKTCQNRIKKWLNTTTPGALFAVHSYFLPNFFSYISIIGSIFWTLQELLYCKLWWSVFSCSQKKKTTFHLHGDNFFTKLVQTDAPLKKSVTTENNEPKSWTEILILFDFCARKLSQCCSYCTYFSILQKRMQQFLYMRKQCLSLWVGVIMAAVDWHLKAGVAKRCAVTFCDSLLTGKHHTTL